jgi:signal transduction histidine kinase/ligand-binding sensor domain-containing protein
MHVLLKSLKTILCTILILHINTQLSIVYAQSDELKFKHFTVEDGLSQNTIYCILEDHYGFMWFGTRTGGLSKFDGYSFTIYRNDEFDSLSISGNEILSLCEDRRGMLWIGTRDDGLNRFDQQTNSFIRYSSNSDDPFSISSKTINSICEISNGSIWFGTNYGLCTYNEEQDNFIWHKDKIDFRSIHIKVISNAGNNRLWLGTKSGLYLYNTQTREIIKHYVHDKDNLSSLSSSYVTALTYDNKGRLWVGTNEDGLNRLDDPKTGTFTRFYNNLNDNSTISSNIIRTVHCDRKGVIWIGTRIALEQLFPEQQDKTNPIFVHHIQDEANEWSLNQNSIYSFYEGRNDNLWIGTYSGGVNLLNNSTPKFRNVKNNIHQSGSLSNNVVSSFTENEEGLWVGTEGGGLNLLDEKTGEFKHFLMDMNKPNALQSNQIKSLFVDSDGDLWVGTFNGLHLYNKEQNGFKQFLDRHSVYSIEEGMKGEIWIGTSKNLFKIQKSNFHIVEYESDVSATGYIQTTDINKVFRDSKGRIWIGTKFGLYLYNREQDNFIGFWHNKNNTKGLSSSKVTCINEDMDGGIWLGTVDGLNKYDEKTNEFLHFDEKEGLPDNVIGNMLFDDRGNLWLTTNKGLSKIYFRAFLNYRLHSDSVDIPKVRTYDTEDGLQGIEFRLNSSFKSKKGEFYLGGTNGYNQFYPDSVKDNPYIPNVLITEFKLFNKPVPFNTKDSPITQPIWLTKSITLSHKQSVLSFEFAALSYTSTRKNQYAYMMEGFEKEWNYSGTKREATYTNLPAGDYVFRVKASNNDGIWNTEGTSLHIKVIPPIWKTWWFRIAIIVLIASIIYIYYSRRLLEVKKINRMLEMKVQERTHELFEKNLLLIEQSESLNETNAQLEERQQIIEEQSEELSAQRDELTTQRDELSAQRDELADSNDVKDKLFSVIAHDLKNPFGTVLGFSELLHSKYRKFDDAKRMRMVTNIFQASQVIYGLITSLLDWSRAQMGNINAVFNSYNINEIITSNIKLASIQSKDKEVEIIRDGILEDVVIKIDKDLISTVIRNLISNAVKFTPIGGKVVVSCEKQADKVIIKVRDNGVGISKDVIPTIFQRGKRHITYGTNNEKGTGLGLLICQDFVLLHKGEIWVESEEGKGSEFGFSLPLEQGS